MDDAPPLHRYTAVVWHKTLQRRLRLVVVRNRNDPAQPRFSGLGAPDTALHGRQLIELDASRCQLEVLFRDRQQFTGLLDCQARAESAVDVHVHASLATLNLARAEDVGLQQGPESPVFAMASWTQRQFNARGLDLVMEK
jgi:hypothetical protein